MSKIQRYSYYSFPDESAFQRMLQTDRDDWMVSQDRVYTEFIERMFAEGLLRREQG